MKRAPARSKEATHERIVEAAARAIRRSGYSGTGVADIMKDAGLTHGGFYAHSPRARRCSPRPPTVPAAKAWR